MPVTAFDPKAFLRTLTSHPGVYRMLDAAGQVLYVGKAKDLRRRVSSYFVRTRNRRVQSMVSQIAGIEVTVTHTEAEALLLENNLIKTLKPRYNVLLRDDKSYPYIYLTTQQAFPRLTFHRGARGRQGRYFGPYPNSGAVRETLHLLQKLFPVRQCEDVFYRNRSRPCLQYQIQRCSGPCVGLISPADYARDVASTVLFLEGRTHQVSDSLVEQMEAAAAALEYERAAVLRDQIAALRQVQERQYVDGESGDLDLVAVAVEGGQACVQVFFVRGGRGLGNRAFYPRLPEGQGEADVLAAFLAQYYLGRPVPAEILVQRAPRDQDLLQEALSQQAGHRVRIRTGVRGERAQRLRMAGHNARLALAARLASQDGYLQRLEALRDALELDETPGRMECFDISHTGGERPQGACVVFDASGPRNRDYRRFNIEGIVPGDDYGAMEQALRRRYTRIRDGEYPAPDILFIDGGQGQLGAAAGVLQELGIAGVTLVGVAKGPERRPGLEQLWLWGQEHPIILPAESSALHLIQQIRDEAHRFAITGHRQRRARARTTSVLEEIPGIGPKRRQQLLRQFGGLQELSRAGVEDLARVTGINRTLAQQIYDAFHGEG
jgi:excinuclease ABC subunit C